MEPRLNLASMSSGAATRMVTGLVCFAYALLLANSAYLQIRSAVLHPEPGDASAYFAAVEAHRTQSDFYDPATLTRIGVEEKLPGGVRAFVYPPVFVQVLSVFGGGSFAHFRVAWILLSAAALYLLFLVTVALVAAESERDSSYVALVSFLLFVPFSPIERELFYGQTSILMAALLYLALWSAGRRRDGLAAAAVTAGTFVKLYPLALVPVFLLRRRLAVCAYIVAGLAAVVAASVLIGGGSDWMHFVSVLRDLSRWVPFTLDAPNYSIQAFIQTVAATLAISPSPTLVVVVSRVAWVAFVAIYLAIMGRRIRSCESMLLVSQVVIVFAMLASNVLWNHLFVVLLPGFVYAGCATTFRAKPGREVWLLVAAFALIAAPDYTTHVGFLARAPFYLVKPLKFYGLLAYLGLCSLLIARLRATNPARLRTII